MALVLLYIVEVQLLKSRLFDKRDFFAAVPNVCALSKPLKSRHLTVTKVSGLETSHNV